MNSDTCNYEIYDVRKFPNKEKGPINGSRMMQCTCTNVDKWSKTNHWCGESLQKGVDL